MCCHSNHKIITFSGSGVSRDEQQGTDTSYKHFPLELLKEHFGLALENLPDVARYAPQDTSAPIIVS